MTEWRIEDLYDLKETIAVDIFDGLKFPWEVWLKIKECMIKRGESSPEDRY